MPPASCRAKIWVNTLRSQMIWSTVSTITTGRRIGITTFVNRCHGPAPSSWAASSSSPGTCVSAA